MFLIPLDFCSLLGHMSNLGRERKQVRASEKIKIKIKIKKREKGPHKWGKVHCDEIAVSTSTL